MKKSILGTVLVILLMCGISKATEYKITGLIDVGPGYGTYVETVKWSPDGTKLAFFDDGNLMLSDTLGNREQIVQIDNIPFMYEWISNEEIMIHLHTKWVNREQFNQLVTVDIASKSLTTIKEYWRGPKYRDKNTDSFTGPYKTIDGKVYYETNVNGIHSIEKTVFPQSKYDQTYNISLSGKNYRVQKYDNAQFKILSSDGIEIPIITPIFGNYSVTQIIVNKDITYVMVEGYIHGIYDSIRIDANSYVGINPPGFEYFSKTFNGEINPQSKEIVTTIPFYNEEEKDYDWTGIFNFETMELTIVDTLLNLDQSFEPTYNPNGRLIALQSGDKIFIITREEK